MMMMMIKIFIKILILMMMMMMLPIVVTLVGIITAVSDVHRNVYAANDRVI